jgi:hypothetical protein
MQLFDDARPSPVDAVNAMMAAFPYSDFTAESQDDRCLPNKH